MCAVQPMKTCASRVTDASWSSSIYRHRASQFMDDNKLSYANLFGYVKEMCSHFEIGIDF